MDSEIDAEALSSSIKERISQESKKQRCICKVHEHLRITNAKAYEPEIIAIGPYHRRKSNLEMMERQKLLFLESFLKRGDKGVKEYISAMKDLEQKARSCYAEPIGVEISDEFIEMLVLDGCFIIELMLKYADKLNEGRSTSCSDDIVRKSNCVLCNTGVLNYTQRLCNEHFY